MDGYRRWREEMESATKDDDDGESGYKLPPTVFVCVYLP